jgi:putative flippase GtrA
LIKRIIALIRRLWAIQFLRFLVVGGVNAVFAYIVFALMILLHLHYTMAVLVSQFCSLLFNFKTTGALVFGNKNNRLIFRFFVVYLATYLLTIGLFKVFKLLGVNTLITGAIIILPTALFSYTMNKKFVFRTSEKSKSGGAT